MTTALVEQDRFREVISTFLTGVTVVTAVDDGVHHGLTLSAVSSVSLDPPTLLVCVNRSSNTSRAILASGGFAVNLLGAQQRDLALRFATKHADKFAEIAVDTDNPMRVPVFPDALGWLVCRVVNQVTAGTHTIVIGEVVVAGGGSGSPLPYFRGGFALPPDAS
jgi:flavin reductase (DIM6/NTAB) family NADH-FMN oxidoreductase RutF